MKEFFRKLSSRASGVLGSPWAFVAALSLVVGWFAAGPFFHFSDAWQLVINTTTDIITFLMVFLIQNTQNRDMRAMHLKLDELIRVGRGARDALVSLEDLSDEELTALKKQFADFRREHPDDSDGDN